MGIVSVGDDNFLYIKGQLVTQIPAAKDADGNDVQKYSPGTNSCDYIITHYTASTTAQSAHNEYMDPSVQLSWHLTIDRDGTVYQLLPFDKIGWHAGESQWGTGLNQIVGMNKCSIGIEHSNAGPLTQKGANYVTWSGQVIPTMDVFIDKDGNPWQAFSPKQLAASKALILELAQIFTVKDILSHEMIAPGRKRDTGPAYQANLDDIRNTYANIPRPLG